MASLEVPNSTSTDSLLARLVGSSEMETSNGAIISRRGTIRGVQDNVKNTVQNFKKMRVKPEASPLMRRVMEVSIKTKREYLVKSVAPCRRSARMKQTGNADNSSSM